MSEPVISIQNLSKKFSFWSNRETSLKNILANPFRHGELRSGYEDISVLEDVSFDIQPGEFVGIIGRNGVGKSTILKLISGIYEPTKGKIKTKGPIAPLIELGAGFDLDLSGYENIFFNAAVIGCGKKQAEDVVDDVVAFSELGEKMNMPVKNFSSGMLVRLGFAIATHIEAPVILVDEVLAVGDIGFQEKCLKKIKELHQKGVTIVLVTHSMSHIEKYCDRCILLNNKAKVFDGDPVECAKRYTDLFQKKIEK